jgi:hypothetical protein
MKKGIFFLVFMLLARFSFSQHHSIIGAWNWSDSAKATSFFFKEKGEVSKYSGSKNDVIIDSKLKRGKYKLSNETLVILWQGSITEKFKIKFINNNSFKLLFYNSQTLIFRRVLDEEVIEE